jgi:hypothetical protein
MYTKLNKNFLNLNFTKWQDLKGSRLFSKYESGTTTLEYFNIKDSDLFKKLHTRRPFTINPERVRFSCITGSGILAPHRDHNTTVALNFYILASADRTVFYKPNNGATSICYHGKEDANVYNLDQLTETDSFIANTNDMYLLDVSSVHSVLKTTQEPRMFISYLWNHVSYEEILNDVIQNIPS